MRQDDHPLLSSRTATVGVSICVVVLLLGTMGLWPWDHDEVHSFVELGLIAPNEFPGPAAQLAQMHKLVPVWQVLQRAVLSVLPHNEWGARALGSSSGALLIVLAFFAGLRSRGIWFGWSLLVMMGGSQTLIWLAQQNRFYALALLWCVLAVIFIWLPDRRWRYDVLAVVCALAAILSHNLTVVLFGLGAAAAVVAWFFGSMSFTAARRAVIPGAMGAVLYLFYLRPLVAGWVSGNTGGTSPLVSFVAQVGVVPLALALLGSVAALRDRTNRALDWWVALLVLCLAFVAVAPYFLGNWNPRYALFFMPPVWVMGAAASETIAAALAPRKLAGVWLVVVLSALMPKLASHFLDGSRHDFRTAAAIVADAPHDDQVLSNWPADLQYYLRPLTGQRPTYWPPANVPSEEFVVVYASNAWEPVLQVPGRNVRIAGEVRKRRFDEQSHVVRVYMVSAR